MKYRDKSKCIPKPSKLFGRQIVLKDPVCVMTSLGVHPSQVAEATENAKAMGCDVDFASRPGRAVMRRSTRRKYMTEINKRRADTANRTEVTDHARIVDRDGGFGDVT